MTEDREPAPQPEKKLREMTFEEFLEGARTEKQKRDLAGIERFMVHLLRQDGFSDEQIRTMNMIDRYRRTPGFHIRKGAEDTDRFLDGLANLYFLRPGDRLTTALVDWCKTRKVHWSIVVAEGLKLFFSTQGVEL